jgi:hypothetical protein
VGDAPSVAEFFKRVLAWPGDEPGFVNIHYTLANPQIHGMGGRPYQTLVDFMAGVEWTKHSKFVKDVYFCLSRQGEVLVKNGKVTAFRRKEKATGIKCIVLDVDVKPPPKGYPNVIEALQAIAAFVASAKLPLPTALVLSGGGIHVYWISDRVLSPEEWQSYAGGLRLLADAHNLRYDHTVTIDIARVLRIPGTFNYKEATPRPVVLKTLLPYDYNFEQVLGHIRTGVAGVQQNTATPARRAVASAPGWILPKRPALKPTAEYLLEIGSVNDKPPLDPRIVISQCPFFKETLRYGGKGQEQGLWMQAGLAMTFCENGREVFHKLSNKHSDYHPDTVDAMFDRKERERDEMDIGWPSCQTFENYGSKQCAGCPHKGKIRSPLNLTAPVAPKQPEASALLTLDGPTVATDPMCLPPDFDVDKEGYITTQVPQTGPGGVTLFIPRRVFNCRIRDPWVEEDRGIHFIAEVSGTDTEKPHTREVLLESKDRGSLQTIKSALAKQHVNFNPEAAPVMEKFMSFWMKQLNRAPAHTPTSYGWWKDNGIVKGWAYGGIIRKEDGSSMIATPADPRTKKIYTPIGSLEKWLEALKLITDQHRPGLEAIAAASFASPLLHWTGQYSGALVAYSQTGANKSTAVNVGGAVWGHPKLTKEVASASKNSIRVKMAELNNLPLYWDDVSEPPDVEKAAAAIKDLTQGKDGGKLNQDRSQRDIGSWQAMLIICSNVSMFDHYVKANKSNAAGLARIFEFYVPKPKEGDGTPGRIRGMSATYLQQELEDNFGRMGEIYRDKCLANPTAMKAFVDATSDQFEKEVGTRGDERFWLAIASTILAGARLANECGATFNIEELHKFLVAAYLGMRERVAEAGVDGSQQENAEKALGEFLKEYTDNTIRSHDMLEGRGGFGRRIKLIDSPKTNKPIHIQWVIDEALLRISRSKFDEFLDRNGYSVSMVHNGLKHYFGLNAKKDNRGNLTAGTNMQGAQETLLVLPVAEDSWLHEVMMAHTSRPKIAGPGETK